MSIGTAPEAVVEARSGRPTMMPWVTPYLTVRDMVASLDFYEAAFGFERREVNSGEDGTIMHARLSWQDGSIMLGPEGAYGAMTKAPATSGVESPVSMYVYCDDVDALAKQAGENGSTIKFGPVDTFWGDRCCSLVDLDGHSWTFATHNGVMAEHFHG